MAIWEAELTMGREGVHPQWERHTLSSWAGVPPPWASRVQTWWQITISPPLNPPAEVILYSFRKDKQMLAPQTTALRKIKSASNRGEQSKHSFTLHWGTQDVWKNCTKARLRFTAQLSSCFHQKHNTKRRNKHVLSPQENTIKKQECQILQRRLGARIDLWPPQSPVHLLP